ncbi:hypothetical protein BU15DRAFT_64910 [Melanogaster broomeanus]|nr:hypothetical protein BU15DRAFT_64910 [Melanogaster broomeanus]
MLPSELPSAEVTLGQLQQAPSPGSSQSTFDQNGAVIHVPTLPNDGPQIAPSLDSRYDAAEEVNHLGNTVGFAHPLHQEPEQTGELAPNDGLRGVRDSFPVPAASTSSPLSVSWGFGVSTRPSERIPRQIIPVAAQSIMRYSRKVRIRNSDSKFTIHPGTKEFIDPQRRNIGDWEPCTHPEGALYFRHPRRVTSIAYGKRYRICTDVNIYKQRNLDVITRCADQLFEWIKTTGLVFSDESELVLELMDDKRVNIWRCGYYFVDHAHKCLFWVHPFQAEPIFGNVKGVKSPSHIRYAMEAQYCISSCDRHMVPTSARQEASVPTTLMQYVYSVRQDDFSSPSRVSSDSAPTARFARMFARTKFFNFSGQVGARLDADQTVYYNRHKSRSILLRCVSPFLFGAPEAHAQGLRTIWIDQLVNHISWKRFIDKLNSEWREFTLYGTVVLNANVVFLAVPNINATARTLNYVSTTCSVGAVILGLLLVRQNRTKGRDSAEDAVYFMTRMTYSIFGTETLAVLYSTPFAFCFLVFQGSNHTTQASVGSAVALVGLLVFWTIWAAWDTYLPRYWIHILRFVNARRRRSKARDPPPLPSQMASSDSDDDVSDVEDQ